MTDAPLSRDESWATEDALLTQMEEEQSQQAPPIQSCHSNDRIFVQHSRKRALIVVVGVVGLVAAAAVCVAGLRAYASHPRKSDALHSSNLWGSSESCEFADGTEDATARRLSPYSMGAPAFSFPELLQAWKRHTGRPCSVHGLLKTPEIHDLVTRNLLLVGKPTLSYRDGPKVRDTVVELFKHISEHLKKHAKSTSERLDLAQISRSQRDAILMALGIIGDTRVQQVGFDVAQAVSGVALAVKDGNAPFADSLRMKSEYVEAHLSGDLVEIAQLREQLVEAPLKELWQNDFYRRQWYATLQDDNMRAMRSVSSDWQATLESTKDEEPQGATAAVMTSEHADLSDLHSALVAGALEEARTVLELMTQITGFALPESATSASTYLDADAARLSCKDVTRSLNQFACPLKFGVQGMEALRAYHSILRENVASWGSKSKDEAKALAAASSGITR